MRTGVQFLLLVLVCGFGMAGWAVDLIQQVPATSPAYEQLRLLEQRGMLPAGRETMLAGVPERVLTRYDFALLLLEPLERCRALVDAQESDALTPEQLRRKELASIALAPLTYTEKSALLAAMEQLLLVFKPDVEELAPGLPQRASAALRLLRFQFARAAARLETPPEAKGVGVSVSVNPRGIPDMMGSPLSLLTPGVMESPTALAGTSRFFEDAPSHILGTKPINSLEAAVDIAFNRFRVYGALSTLPGQDIFQWISLKGTGTYKLGFAVDFGHLKDVNISGILEYHIQRSLEQGDNVDTNTGAVGGIGIRW